MEKEHILNLIEKATSGCQKSYSALYAKYFPQTRAYCASLLRKNWNDVAVQDLTAEVLSKVFTKLHLYSGRWYLAVWIKAVAINTRRDALRKQQSQQSYHFIDIDDSRKVYGIESGTTADSRMICSDIMLAVQKVIENSNPSHIPILKLRYLEEKSYAEISSITKTKVASISSVLSRTKQKMKSKLFR